MKTLPVVTLAALLLATTAMAQTSNRQDAAGRAGPFVIDMASLKQEVVEAAWSATSF